MRGGKSLVILLLVAAGLGAYIYFVESKKDLDTTVKKAKVFGLEPGKIEQIEVHAANGDVTTMKKAASDWQIATPAGLEADSAEINSLVAALESLEAQRTVDENPSSVKEFGLEPARFSLSFRAAGEATDRRLNVGNKTPQGSDLYARVEGQPKLILISSYVEESLNRTTFDLRDKSVLKFTRDGVDSLSLEATGNPTLAFARKGDDWRFTAPVAGKSDFSAIDGIIGQLFQARMKAIVSQTEPSAVDLKTYGLDKPQALATLGAGSTRATLAIGAKKDDTTLYARDLARPLVFTVENAVLEGLKRKAEDLKSKDIFAFRTFTAVGADLTYAGQTFTFAKEKAPPPPKDAKDQTPAADVWKQLKPAAKDVDQTKITDLLTGLSNLRAEKFADKPFASGEDFIVTSRFGDPASPKEEKVTFRKSGGVVHALLTGEGGASIVPTAEFDKLVTQFKEISGIK